MRKKLLLMFATAGALHLGVTAQTLTPVLVGSAGDFNSITNFSLSSSVGEAVITTQGPVNNTYLTQGFQQPSSTGIQALTVTFSEQNSTCIGANNGHGIAQVMTGRAPFTYQWAPSGGTTTSSSMTDTSGFLAPGTYTVTVTDANGFTVTDSVVVNEDPNNCGITIYSGITPNGDNHNDTWVIDYIDLYPNNLVAIFNRWGQRVWSAAGYNNADIVWNGTNDSGQPLPDATYYYVINADNKTYTGWVELTH